MKKNIFLCFILFLITVLILPVYGSAYDYGENDIIIDFLPGDIDNNGKVNSADARLCLRAAANLETLTADQIKVVDFDGTGKINSSDARKILRTSAGLDILTVTINIEQGQNLVVGPLKIWGIKCTPQEQNDNLTVLKTTAPDKPELAGEPSTSFFTINATESGVYNLAFTSYQPWIGDETGHLYIALNVK